MKAKLIFDVPEEQKAFMAAAKANDMAMALWDIVYNVGKGVLGHYEGMKDEQYDKLTPMDGVELYRARISSVLDENGIDVDDLTE